MKYLTIIFMVFLAINGSVSGTTYLSDRDMREKTEQRTIIEQFSLNETQVLVIMDDGTAWRSQAAGDPILAVGKTINIENYSDPEAGQNYRFVFGYYQGFDEHWREIRKGARLLLIGINAGDSEPLPYSDYQENFKIEQIVNDQGREILFLNNGMFVIMPPHHGGHTAGDQLKIHVMKNGTTAYLIRQLDADGQEVKIPMHRASSRGFIAN